jgi:hypothetical protein
MKLRSALFVILASTTVSAQSQSNPVCVTHFYNQSNYKWSIYNFDGRKDTLFIPPNTTVTISWGTTSAVTISGSIPNGPYRQQFQVQQANSCVVIQSQGATGSLLLNKPGSGDITTCAGGC